MTSANKQLLKEVMRLDLERQQHQFLRRAYGSRHRLTSHQALSVMRTAVREQTHYSRLTVQRVGAHLLGDERQELQRELARAKQLQRLDVDGALDSLTELKDTVDDVNCAFVDSVSSTCDLELEADDAENAT
ncbi:tegument protein UL14 [Panine betaherpesvirus 2]|uniref:Tegument protein UL14 n=1 Tax=Panine betaherpesvirus 2 TaxID=188763 RepID=Q8QS04_9BETA|nr:tegument protein UL14 [Panine betaherpesvirus 2]AAM00734.1 tegument protein UL14 [Panine betaherpesvirus 2]QXV67845.1 tegument protein UL14 [Panine betaherpesvirus 2]